MDALQERANQEPAKPEKRGSVRAGCVRRTAGSADPAQGASRVMSDLLTAGSKEDEIARTASVPKAFVLPN